MIVQCGYCDWTVGPCCPRCNKEWGKPKSPLLTPELAERLAERLVRERWVDSRVEETRLVEFILRVADEAGKEARG